MGLKKLSLIVIILSLGLYAQAAEELDVPVDELARESVVPVFDNVISVKNRNVSTTGRIDLSLFYGLALTEAIADTSKYGIELNYHLNEFHTLGILFAMTNNGLSKDAQGLKNQFGLDYNRVPKPQNTMMLNYDYSPFYGKLSVTKESVINTTIYGSIALGMVKYQHKSYPALSLGIGERFYFTPNFSLKADFKIYAHNAPVPFKGGVLHDGSAGSSADPVPNYDVFDDRLTYITNLQLGVNYLF